MLYLKQATASQAVLIGPFIDDVDGKTAETGLTIANTDIRLSANGGNMFAKTSGGGTHDEAGWYTTTLDATDTATVGRLQISTDVTGALPTWGEFQVIEEAIYDALIAANATGELLVDVVKVSGDSVAADNLESQYDTTGLTGDTFPASQAQIAGITNTGSAVNISASSYVLTTGTQSSGTYTVTAPLDGVNHEHTDDTGAMDLYYQFLVGSGTPSGVTITGYLNSANDDLEVYGYDWVAAGWVQIGTLGGKNASSNEVNSYGMFVNMVGSGADEGKVRVRFTDGAFTLTTATLAIDQIYVTYSRGAEGYDNGAIWVDTTVSNTNTVVGVDGVARNPVSTIAAANTLSASTNLNRFEIASGSSITFAATQNSQLFQGHGWTLALGGQDIDDCHIFDAQVSGIGTAATEMEFHTCEIGTASFQKSHCYTCGFEGTLTQTLAGDYNYIDCYSLVAGASAPIFTKTAGQTITAQWRRWSGGITVSGLESGDVLTISGELGTVTLNGADATVELRGTYKALVNNLTGSPTVNTDGAILAADVAATKAVTDTQARSSATIVDGAAETGTLSTTEMTTGLTVSVADQYNGRIIIFASDTTTAALRGQATDITATTILNGKLGFTALTTAPANGDVFAIV